MLTATHTTALNLLSVVRSTSGWVWSSSGALTEVAADTMRRADYDPSSLTWRGWRIEGPATNHITNGRLEGIVDGSPGTPPTGMSVSGPAGLTGAMAGHGTQSGIPYMDVRVSGTPGSTGNYRIVLRSATGATAAQGETWVIRGGIRLAAGSTTNVGTITLRVNELSSGGTLLNGGGVNVSPTSGVLRTALVTGTRTMANASTANAGADIVLGVTSGQAVDITLRICILGLWKSSFQFSPSFPPVSSLGSHTRAADDATLAITDGFSAAQGTVCIDFTPGQTVGDTTRGIFSVDDGTNLNRIDACMSAANLGVVLVVYSGGVLQVAALSIGTATVLTRNTLRLSWGPAGYYASLNDAAAVSASLGTAPAGLWRLKLGNRGGGALVTEYLNGWLGPRGAYFPRQYTDVAAPDGFTIRNR